MLSPAPLVRDLSMDPASFGRIEATNESLGDIGRTILESLSQSLQLGLNKNLATHHHKGQVSPTALGILKYLPYKVQIQGNTVGHVPHTDIGSLSIVCIFRRARTSSLITREKTRGCTFHREKDVWYATLETLFEFLPDNILRLSLHRVTPFPAEAGKVKLTVVYIMRPETDAVFVDREGK